MSSELCPQTIRPSPQYIGQNSLSSSLTRVHCPVVPPLQPPPAAHVPQTLPNSSSMPGAGSVWLHTSTSCAEPGSKLRTEYKQYPYTRFQYSPRVERGVTEEPIHGRSRTGSQASEGETRGSNGGATPMIYHNSAIFQYIHEKSVSAEEEKDCDQALWILVGSILPV